MVHFQNWTSGGKCLCRLASSSKFKPTWRKKVSELYKGTIGCIDKTSQHRKTSTKRVWDPGSEHLFIRHRGGWKVGARKEQNSLSWKTSPLRKTSTCSLGRRFLLETLRHRKGLVADGHAEKFSKLVPYRQERVQDRFAER